MEKKRRFRGNSEKLPHIVEKIRKNKISMKFYNKYYLKGPNTNFDVYEVRYKVHSGHS